MRNIKYGKFADNKMPTRDDWMDTPIGFHNATRREEKRILDSIKNEYYTIDKESGKALVVTDPTFIEKALARAKYIVTGNKKKVVGYRDDGVISKDSEQSEAESWKVDPNTIDHNIKSKASSKEKETETEQRDI